jgi:hypothetical protein
MKWIQIFHLNWRNLDSKSMSLNHLHRRPKLEEVQSQAAHSQEYNC